MHIADLATSGQIFSRVKMQNPWLVCDMAIAIWKIHFLRGDSTL